MLHLACGSGLNEFGCGPRPRWETHQAGTLFVRRSVIGNAWGSVPNPPESGILDVVTRYASKLFAPGHWELHMIAPTGVADIKSPKFAGHETFTARLVDGETPALEDGGRQTF